MVSFDIAGTPKRKTEQHCRHRPLRYLKGELMSRVVIGNSLRLSVANRIQRQALQAIRYPSELSFDRPPSKGQPFRQFHIRSPGWRLRSKPTERCSVLGTTL